MTAFTDLIAQWRDHEPAQPRLTWYGPESERVELSGRVLANWVIKAANMLTAEADVEPGARVRLDLPPHWRTLVWALGTWTAGGEVVLPSETGDDEDPVDEYVSPFDDGLDDDLADEDDAQEDEDEEFLDDDEDPEPDAIVTDRPVGDGGTALVLAIALPALATEVTEGLPAGALDAAASLMSYGDELEDVWDIAEKDPALSGGDVVALDGEPLVEHGDLAAWARQQSPASFRRGDRLRTLCSPGSVAELLAHTLTVWLADGSVVVLHESIDHREHTRLAEAEHATARC